MEMMEEVFVASQFYCHLFFVTFSPPDVNLTGLVQGTGQQYVILAYGSFQ